MTHALQLLPEWYPQEAIILAWPDEKTDWAPWLDSVRKTYLALIHAISQQNCGVILLIRPSEIATFEAMGGSLSRVLLVEADYNDTWVRDYAFLTCDSAKGMQPVEYKFNGWGEKFDASLDNLINQTVLADMCRLPLISYEEVCEGGALEIDQQGRLLSTALCLSNPKRNGVLTLEKYAQRFAEQLGASQTFFFEQGHLQGDDTDGHIDTLVRFTSDQALVVQACANNPDDVHFAGLQGLVEECQRALPDHHVWQLPLPAVYNAQGERLPASYANYLINNQQILFPVYQQREDELALEIISKAYPQHKIVAIDALPLVQQYGSVHCISMQVPAGTFKQTVINQFSQGIAKYEP